MYVGGVAVLGGGLVGLACSVAVPVAVCPRGAYGTTRTVYVPDVGGSSTVSGSEEEAELAMIARLASSTYRSKSAALFGHWRLIFSWWVVS